MAVVYKTFNIALDVARARTSVKNILVEGDTANKFVITLTDDGVAVDLSTARVVANFSNTNGTFQQSSFGASATITISGDSHNIITIPLATTSVADGNNLCELQILSDTLYDKLITTARISFTGRKAILNDETIAATTEYAVLVDLISQVTVALSDHQSDWNESDSELVTYIKNKPVVGTDIQQNTDGLTAETVIANGDYFPYYDTSETAHRKTLWSSIITAIRTALFGTSSGILKANGSGVISAATSNTDYAAATHASRHAYGAADAITTDATPTESSTNPLQSGGAYTALAGKLPYDVSPATLLINGGFDIWQGGTSFTATGYTADQWRLTLGSGMAVTVTRQAFTVGQTDVPTEPTYYAKLAISNAGTADGYFEQRIESVRTVAGADIAYSFYAKCDSDTYAAKVRMVQNFGSGGSADVASSDQDITLTTSWQRFTGTFSLASISGKTIGAGDYLSVRVVLPTASGTKTISIATAQANPGTVALPYVKVSNLTELEHCKRYAVLSGVANGLIARMVFYQSNYIIFHIPTTVTMRADPTFLGTANTDTIVLTTAASAQTGFSFVATAVPSGVYITATKNSHGLTDAVLLFSASGGLVARL